MLKPTDSEQPHTPDGAAESAVTERPNAAPVDSFCAAHPEEPAVFICSRCGRFACDDCGTPLPSRQDNGVLCTECLATVGVPLFPRPSWRWVVSWVFATLIGAGGGIAAGVLNRITKGSLPQLPSVLLWTLWVLVGCFAFAGAQALAFSSLQRSPRQWISVTALPFAASFLIPDLLEVSFKLKPASMGPLSLVLAFLVPATVQWLLVRRWYERAWLWLPGCVLALIAGALGASTFARWIAHLGVETRGLSVSAVSLLLLGVLPYAFVQGLMLKALPLRGRLEAGQS